MDGIQKANQGIYNKFWGDSITMNERPVIASGFGFQDVPNFMEDLDKCRWIIKKSMEDGWKVVIESHEDMTFTVNLRKNDAEHSFSSESLSCAVASCVSMAYAIEV